jgi:hypothetical protein
MLEILKTLLPALSQKKKPEEEYLGGHTATKPGYFTVEKSSFL